MRVVVAHLGMEPVWSTRRHPADAKKGGFGENDSARFRPSTSTPLHRPASRIFSCSRTCAAEREEVDCLRRQCRDQFE